MKTKLKIHLKLGKQLNTLDLGNINTHYLQTAKKTNNNKLYWVVHFTIA